MNHINYFDFGVHNGDEIEMFLNAVKPLVGSVIFTPKVYGFEAHPDLCFQARARYSEYDNVRIVNEAICNHNEVIKLYIAESNKMEGNSIFKGKRNVDPLNFEVVKGTKFSTWLKQNQIPYKKCINVVRYNIEGAEIYLFEDIIDNCINEHIDIYLGAADGDDIAKCSEISHLQNDFKKKLESECIKVHQFCSASPNNVSEEFIRRKITDIVRFNEQ